MKGRCVICGHIGSLTRDHVPPRGVTPAHPIEVRRLGAVIEGGHAHQHLPHRHYQAPVFPSLCAVCNTDRLGKLYDPELIRFSDGLASWVRGAYEIGLTLPAASVSILPLAVARAVVGHLLAAEERPDATLPLVDAALLKEMREYFLGLTSTGPHFQIFVWPYSGNELVIVRGFAIARVLGRKHHWIVGDVLKFFPVAFWVVSEQPTDVEFGFAKLELTKSNETLIEIPLRNVPPLGWPERPRDDEVVLLSGERSHIARGIRAPHRT